MSLSIEKTDGYSMGTEPIETLGFINESELEEALIPLMQDIEPDDSLAAQVINWYEFACKACNRKEQPSKWFRALRCFLSMNSEQRIEAAKQRVKELQCLIRHWEGSNASSEKVVAFELIEGVVNEDYESNAA